MSQKTIKSFECKDLYSSIWLAVVFLNPEKVVRTILPMGHLNSFLPWNIKHIHNDNRKSVLVHSVLLCCCFYSLWLQSDCFNTTQKTGLEQIDMKTSSKKKMSSRALFFTVHCSWYLVIANRFLFFVVVVVSFRFVLVLAKVIVDLCNYLLHLNMSRGFLNHGNLLHETLSTRYESTENSGAHNCCNWLVFRNRCTQNTSSKQTFTLYSRFKSSFRLQFKISDVFCAKIC